MEKQTCPRRMNECGPWEHNPLLDHWDTDRWLIDPDAVKKKHEEEDKNSKAIIHRGMNNDLWIWSWGPPRTCSFCGGINPEDAIRLISEGWEIDGTYKAYKVYLHPPGFHIKHRAFMASMHDLSREPGQGVPSVWDPTPPVKLYTMHFTEEQITKFNETLKNYKA